MDFAKSQPPALGVDRAHLPGQRAKREMAFETFCVTNESAIAAKILKRIARRIERMLVFIGSIQLPCALRHDLDLRDRSPAAPRAECRKVWG